MKKWFWLFPIIVLAVLFFWLADSNQTKPSGLQVAATIYPLWEFANTIAGSDAQVELLLPPGADPHHWEPTARDIVKLVEAQVIICQGLSFEPWVAKSASAAAIVQEAVPESDDPHFWLDPLLAKEVAEKITAALVKADTANARKYEERGQALAAKLDQLHEEYTRELADVKIRTFITTHQAFDYLGKRYNLNPVALKGVHAEGEPRPGDLMRITQLAKKEGVKVIFKEPHESPRLAEVIAEEIGGEVRELHPIGALTARDEGEDYFSLMRRNLKELKAALAGDDK